MSEKAKVTDLIKDALEMDDYDIAINFIISGLLLTGENEDKNRRENKKKMLKEIMEFCKEGNADKEKDKCLRKKAEIIAKYLEDVE